MLQRILSVGIICVLAVTGARAEDSLRMKEVRRIADALEQPAVAKGDRQIRMPQAPEGFQLQLRGTDKLPVVDASGKIGKPLTDQEVQLYFVLTDQKTGLKQDVTHLNVQIAGEMPVVAGANACPDVIPALREWSGGEGKFGFGQTGTIVLDPAFEKELRAGAEQFAADLKETGDYRYSVKTGKPEAGMIYMTLATEDKQLGEEGYRLTLDKDIKIEAVAPHGAFWATRTILMMLNQQGTALVKGTARDYPKYARRGFSLDVARKFIRLPFIQDYVKIMSYYKMNDFAIHLNDNGFKQYFDNDWDKTYAAFRLESDFFPELTAKDGSYTKKEFTDLQKLGMRYGVNVFPEIDVPAHSLAFSHYRESLGSKKYGMDHLDLLNPAVYPFLDSLFLEYLGGAEPVFTGPDVHIGTDEYSKEVAEEFRAFTDHYLRYVQGFGKRARMWGALTHAQGKTPVTSENVVMNAWYNGYADPKAMIEQGYDLMSMPDGYLYIVPAAGYYYDYLNIKHLFDVWEPVMIGNQTFPKGHPQVLGGAFAVWNDHCGNGITEKDIHHRAFPAMQVLAQKMWTGKRAGDDFAHFSNVAASLPEAPGVNIMAKVASKGDLVLAYRAGERRLKDGSGNGYEPLKLQGVKLDKAEGMIFNGGSVVTLPVPEIGYDYTVCFDLNAAEQNPVNAVLFGSPNAVVVLNEKESGKLAFQREGYSYHFNYEPPVGKWVNIAIEGNNKGTSLYVDGQLVEKLEGNKKVVKDMRGKDNFLHYQQTLVFPLQQIGDQQNGFRGKLRNLEVYNKNNHK